MSTETNKALARRYTLEPWVHGKLETFDELCGLKFVHYSPDGSTRDAKSFKSAVADWRRAMPDLNLTIHEIVAEGDLVIYRWSQTGTHLGELEGIKPTGKKVSSHGITILRFADGKVVEDRYDSGGPSFKEQVS